MKLTDKQSKFCEEYIKNGYNGTKAYQVAYETDNKQVAGTEAYKMLKNPRIQDELDNIESSFRIVGYKAGITKEKIMKILFHMMSATKKGEPDYIAINNAITTYAKLTGDFTERKKIEVDDKRDMGDIDPNALSPEERKELKEQLLKNL